MSRLLEICVDDAQGVNAAVEGGADRIELCSSLAVGGLTPSVGLMRVAARAPIPCYAMIRPRGGDFVFSADEMDQMKCEIDVVRAAGLAGVVLGVSRKDMTLDEEALRILVEHAEGLGKTLHRAIDLVPDKLEAVELAVSLGFDRILSSGGGLSAPDGIFHLSGMWEKAAGRISIMPGAGVTADNVQGLLDRVPFTEIHSACATTYRPDRTLVGFEFAFAEMRRTDRDKVARLAAVVHGTG